MPDWSITGNATAATPCCRLPPSLIQATASMSATVTPLITAAVLSLFRCILARQPSPALESLPPRTDTHTWTPISILVSVFAQPTNHLGYNCRILRHALLRAKLRVRWSRIRFSMLLRQRNRSQPSCCPWPNTHTQVRGRPNRILWRPKSHPNLLRHTFSNTNPNTDPFTRTSRIHNRER
jgi:hypothetical protein